MKNPFDHPAMIDIGLFLSRLTLGLNMLIAGWNKITGLGLGGFADGPFMSLKPGWLPDAVARPYGYMIPILEFAGGLLIVIGLFTRWAAGVTALMLLSIFIAVLGQKGLSGGEKVAIHYSIVFACLAFILAVIGAGRLSLDALYFSGGGPAPKGKA